MVSHLAQEWHILVTDRECLDLTGFADSDTPQLRFKMENLVHGQLVVERAYMIDPTRRFCKLEYRRLSVNEVLLRGQVVRITQLRSEHSASARWRMWTTDPVECRFKEEPISSELLNAVLCKAFDAVLSEAQAVDYETYPYFDLARTPISLIDGKDQFFL